MRKQMTKKKMPEIYGKAVRAFMSAVLAAGTCMPAASAFAELPEGQSAEGNTSLTLHLEKPDEYGGTGDYATEEHANPDVRPEPDGDGLGDNLMFTVPAQVNYIVKADGSMVGASSYIENESAYQARVSSAQVVQNASAGWAVEADAMSSTTANVVDFLIGPEQDQLAGASYLSKRDVSKPDAWNMSYACVTGDTDKVALVTTGHMNNVAKNIAESGEKFASVQWYVRPGNVSVGTLNIPSTFEHGSVAVRDSSGNETASPYTGTIVTLDCSPDAGYALDSVNVTDGNGDPVSVTVDGNTATFTMPESATVSVTFSKIRAQAGLTSSGVLVLAKSAKALAVGDAIEGAGAIAKVYGNPEEWTVGAPEWAADAASITKVSIPETLTMQTCASMFAGMSNLTEIEGLSNLNTEAVTNFSHMFDGCSSVESLDLSGMNTHKGADMTDMFTGMSSLQSVDLDECFGFAGRFIDDDAKKAYLPELQSVGKYSGKWTYEDNPGMQYSPAELTDYCYLFSTPGTVVWGTIWDARKPYALYGSAEGGSQNVLVLFTEADGMTASQLDSKVNLTATVTVDGVTYTGRLMGGPNHRYETGGEVWSGYAENATDVVIADRIVPSTMEGWFAGMERLTTIQGIENIDTSECTSMANLFNGCSSLTTLDLTTFDTSKVTDMSGMFEGCSSLASIYRAEDFDTSSATASTGMFAGCTSLVGGNGTAYDSTKVDKSYARVDGLSGQPGYFTAKESISACSHLNTYTRTVNYCIDMGEVNCCGDSNEDIEFQVCRDCGLIRALNSGYCGSCTDEDHWSKYVGKWCDPHKYPYDNSELRAALGIT